jgi:glyoxylase-like metal-dependent hydrolase (beta-lactamase superfamily II)
MTDQHEAYAVRFAHSGPRKRSENFLGGDPHDGDMPLDYFVFVIRGPAGIWIVDTGFDAAVARTRNRIFLRCPGEALRLIGVDPADVANVVLTHLHYDHAGNHDLFPNATFHLQASEMAYATGPCMCHGMLRIGYDPEDLAAALRKLFAGRLAYHDGDADLASGLSLHRIGGHTDGQQVVRVHTRRGWMALASDAVHYRENLTANRPFPWLYHTGAVLDGFTRLRRLADAEELIVPGHDPLIMTLFPAANEAARDIVVRLD